MVCNVWFNHANHNWFNLTAFHIEDYKVQGETERDDWLKDLICKWTCWRNRACKDVQLGDRAVQSGA